MVYTRGAALFYSPHSAPLTTWTEAGQHFAFDDSSHFREELLNDFDFLYLGSGLAMELLDEATNGSSAFRVAGLTATLAKQAKGPAFGMSLLDSY